MTVKLSSKVAVAGFACALLTACGTTLDDKAFTTVTVTDGPVQQVPAGSVVSAPGSGTNGQAPGTTTGGGTTPGGGSVVAVPGGGTVSGGSTGTAGGKPGGGVVKHLVAPTKIDPSLAPVQVGVFYYTGLTLGNSKDPVGGPKAVIKYLNDHGGLAGHEVQGVFTPINSIDLAPYATTLQKVCDAWTQDNHVIAGISTGNAPIDLIRCLNSRGVVGLMGANTIQKSFQDYQALPYMVNPGELASEVQDRALIDSLWRQGFFKKGDKIGVFYETYAGSTNAYKKALVPQLAKYGLKVSESFAAKFPESVPEVTSALNSLRTPTLRMKAEGITKVIFAGTGEMTTVTQYADQQKYYPKYGFSTNEQPIVKEKMKYARRVLPGSMGIGWQPLTDVSQNVPSGNKASQTCLQIMKPVGGITDAVSQWAAETYCDTILVLGAGAAQNPVKKMTGAALLEGLNRLGTSYQSPFNLGTGLSADHRWGVTMARDFAYSTKCWCVQYTSKPRPVS